MGAAAPKPPLAIPPHSKLWGFLAFSRERFIARVHKLMSIWIFSKTNLLMFYE